MQQIPWSVVSSAMVDEYSEIVKIGLDKDAGLIDKFLRRGLKKTTEEGTEAVAKKVVRRAAAPMPMPPKGVPVSKQTSYPV